MKVTKITGDMIMTADKMRLLLPGGMGVNMYVGRRCWLRAYEDQPDYSENYIPCTCVSAFTCSTHGMKGTESYKEFRDVTVDIHVQEGANVTTIRRVFKEEQLLFMREYEYMELTEDMVDALVIPHPGMEIEVGSTCWVHRYPESETRHDRDKSLSYYPAVVLDVDDKTTLLKLEIIRYPYHNRKEECRIESRFRQSVYFYRPTPEQEVRRVELIAKRLRDAEEKAERDRNDPCKCY